MHGLKPKEDQFHLVMLSKATPEDSNHRREHATDVKENLTKKRGNNLETLVNSNR